MRRISRIPLSLDALRDARRALLRHRASSFFIIATLAISTGPLAVTWGLLKPTSIDAMGIAHPQQLIRIRSRLEQAPTARGELLSAIEVAELRARVRAVPDLASEERGTASATTNGTSMPVAVAVVDGEYFHTLGVSTARGRPIGEGDAESMDDAAVAVISTTFWESALGRNAAVIGSHIQLDGHPFEIVGVARPEFAGPVATAPIAVWIPQPQRGAITELSGATPASRALSIYARVPSNRTLASVDADLRKVSIDLRPVIDDPLGHRVYLADSFAAPTVSSGTGSLTGLRLGLLIMTALIFVIACVNITGMTLARAVAEEHTVAIRLALGGSHGRLVLTAFFEALVLSIAGIAGGLLLAVWILAFIRATNDGMEAMQLDWRAIWLAGGLCVSCALSLVLLPARHWRRLHIAARLIAVRQTERREARSVRELLVVLQLASVIVVSTSTVIVMRSIQQLRAVDPGFDGTGIVSVVVPWRRVVPGEVRPLSTQQVVDVIRGLDGVRSAAAGMVPLLFNATPFTKIVDTVAVANANRPAAKIAWDDIGLGYFATLGVRVVEGRDFDATDTPDAPRRAMVNVSMARLYWPGASPVGRRLYVIGENGVRAPVEVIGVVADFYSDFVGEGMRPRLFLTTSQAGSVGTIYVRTKNPAAMSQLRATLTRVLGAPPTLIPFDQIKDRGLTFHKNTAVVTMMMSSICIALSMVGLYGLLSFDVARRRREFGIRRALGANGRNIVWLVGSQALRLIGLALLPAIPLSMLTSRLVSILAFHVSAGEPAVMATMIVTLLAIAGVAAGRPAWSAIRSEPAICLRSE